MLSPLGAPAHSLGSAVARSCAGTLGSLGRQLQDLGYRPQERLNRPLLKRFKVMAWNLDEFELAGSRSYDGGRYDHGAKSERAVESIRDILLDEDPDVILLTEISHVDSIRRFANDERYLNGHWDLMIHPDDHFSGNIGFLVKKGLPLSFRFETHLQATRTRQDGRRVPVFTRDVPALIVQGEGNADRSTVVFLGLHAKSMRDSHDGDPLNVRRRTREFAGVQSIKAHYRKRFPGAKFVTLGDMNTDTLRAPEYRIMKSDAASFLDLTVRGSSPESRVTHTFHRINPNTGETVGTKALQLDDILVDNLLKPYFVEGYVYRFLDSLGRRKPLPKTLGERKENPSDHFPVISVFDFFKLFYGRDRPVARPND
jgi:hypothetical protein